MARRKPKQRPKRLKAPDSDYTDPDGNVLTLRGSLTPATRLQYAETLAGGGPAATREDAWQRAVEFLFERLAVRWEIAGVGEGGGGGGSPINRQRELLARFRMASPAERAWVRSVLREHCAEHFPDIQAP
jgi:hypothetical protein